MITAALASHERRRRRWGLYPTIGGGGPPFGLTLRQEPHCCRQNAAPAQRPVWGRRQSQSPARLWMYLCQHMTALSKLAGFISTIIGPASHRRSRTFRTEHRPRPPAPRHLSTARSMRPAPAPALRRRRQPARSGQVGENIEREKGGTARERKSARHCRASARSEGEEVDRRRWRWREVMARHLGRGSGGRRRCKVCSVSHRRTELQEREPPGIKAMESVSCTS